MMYGIPNEDEYWENVRERMENPPRYPWDDPPEPEQDCLFLDDLEDEIREKRGYPVEELYEGDLLEIVKEQTGIEPINAKYDPVFFCIEYQYMEEGDV